MSSELREQFFYIHRSFQKTGVHFLLKCEMQMNEMVILQSIAGTCCKECPCMNLDVPKMQKKLNISKPAISYILNTLEKRNISPVRSTQKTGVRYPSAPLRKEGSC